MFYYYEKDGKILASDRSDLPYTPGTPRAGEPIYYLVEGDPILGRGSFKVNAPGQLLAPHSLEVLDASRLPQLELDEALSAALDAGQLTAVNTGRIGWESILAAAPNTGKKRVHILAIGDVGSTLLTGLKLLGGDMISTIGICDLSDQITARWEFEMGQINLPWDYNAFPDVEVVKPENLFDCDVFVFVASKGIPPVGSQVKDVRMAQFENNAAIVKTYARMARKANFQGLWCAVSDPVDPLAKTAYLESNKDEDGNWDGRGLRPEQVQGYGLGVMNARAAYFAKRDEKLSSFLTEGRSFGPHGTGLFIANSIENYNEEISQELTHKTVTANLVMREIGFKPYVAPALSSGALSILLTLRGEWHCGSVFLDGIFMGCKNRYTPAGVETELLPHIPDPLFAHIQEAADHLKTIL
ncbi:MAG: lactate dehydrogenase [Flintibacter sp.]|uniref:lactate dehydrogenase n=1 Tax=Flintibacter sp. TaxID=1918624 RepID=UPI0026741231|nr:lactate dehydrogenase [Flintibacter sp.]MCI6150450.1 lactate dehydrogenase [Flintibacter sp.]MDD7116048.1 lactate dehydrogenase [Flintibacter sp.]MDY5039051.1 lactate dehydrogenase [Lawsonibacter sp.]